MCKFRKIICTRGSDTLSNRNGARWTVVSKKRSSKIAVAPPFRRRTSTKILHQKEYLPPVGRSGVPARSRRPTCYNT